MLSSLDLHVCAIFVLFVLSWCGSRSGANGDKPLVCIQALPPLKRKTAVPNIPNWMYTWTNYGKKQLYIRIFKTYPQKPSKYEAHTVQPLSLLLYLLTYHLQDLFKQKLDIIFANSNHNKSSIQANARHLKTESAPNARKPSIVLQLLGS